VFTILFSEEQALKAMGDLAERLEAFPGSFKKAIKKGLRFTGKDVKKLAVNRLAERYRAKKGDIGRKIEVQAINSGYGVRIWGVGRNLLISAFTATPKMVKDKYGITHKGAKVAVLKATKPKLLKGAFFGKDMVFTRQTSRAYPIKAVYGPSIVGFFSDKKELEDLTEKGFENLLKNMRRGADRELRRLIYGKGNQGA
jgi:hypothetical protein